MMKKYGYIKTWGHKHIVIIIIIVYVCLTNVNITFDIIFRFTSAAIATVVTVAEILKNNGFAVEMSEFLLLSVWLSQPF